MSRKPRTLVVTLAASSFSSLDPGAAFCLSSEAMVSFAVFTAWVPGPCLPGAGAVAVGAAGAFGVCAPAELASAHTSASAPRPAGSRRTGRGDRRERRDIGMGSLSGTAGSGAEFTGGSIEAYHGHVPLEDGLRPARAHLEPRDVRVCQILGLGGADRLGLEHRGEPGPRGLLAGLRGLDLG